MGSVRTRDGSDLLFIDFRYRGVRCREKSNLKDSPSNRRKLEKLLECIEAEITLGIFDYGKYFPKSKRSTQFAEREQKMSPATGSVPSFSECTETWFSEVEHEWRNSHRENTRHILDYHLLPELLKLVILIK